MNARAEALLGSVRARIDAVGTIERARGSVRGHEIKIVIEHVLACPQNRHTLDQAARLARMQGGLRFGETFRGITGRSFSDFTRRVQADFAVLEIALTTDSLQKIAAGLGFADVSAMAEQITELCGISIEELVRGLRS